MGIYSPSLNFGCAFWLYIQQKQRDKIYYTQQQASCRGCMWILVQHNGKLDELISIHLGKRRGKRWRHRRETTRDDANTSLIAPCVSRFRCTLKLTRLSRSIRIPPLRCTTVLAVTSSSNNRMATQNASALWQLALQGITACSHYIWVIDGCQAGVYTIF